MRRTTAPAARSRRTLRRKPHDHCWHLGCILPRVPANDRADRWNAECIAIATRELDRLDGYATAQASAADAAAKAAAEHGEAVGASGTAVVSTAACRRLFSLGCVFTPIARALLQGGSVRQFCGEALEMESTVPEPQPVAPVAEVAREPAATAADDVLLADCRAPPLSFPSCSGRTRTCIDAFVHDRRLLLDRRGPCPRPGSGPSGCPGDTRRPRS